MTGGPDGDVDPRTASTLADAARLTGAHCAGCQTVICGHEAVFSLVLGYKNAPRCMACVADHMREASADLRERTLSYVRHHDCFRAAWRHASELEQFGGEAMRPACLWPEHVPAEVPDATPPAGRGAAAATPTTQRPNEAVAGRWDAGDLGCGDLVLELRLRLRELQPGEIFELRATDAGAPADLPSWCHLTGHQLLDATHPVYRIRRKA